MNTITLKIDIPYTDFLKIISFSKNKNFDELIVSILIYFFNTYFGVLLDKKFFRTLNK